MSNMSINEMYHEYVRKPMLEHVYSNPNYSPLEKIDKTVQLYLLDVIDEESLLASILIYKEIYKERNLREREKFMKRTGHVC